MLEWKCDGWKEKKSCVSSAILHIGGDLKKEMKQKYWVG